MKRKQSQTPDGPKNTKEGLGQWLSRLQSWVSTSEPSVQAFKQHKKMVYRSAGVSLNDPQAGAKLQ